jgi:RNA polymerase sigma-70 factor, ECF subfamily
VAQDALLRAWRRRGTLRDDARRKEWLATIVRNEAFRQRARLRPDPIEEVETFEAVEDEAVIATVERADLHAALKCLDERDRQLVKLRYDEDLTQEAIAKRLGIPEGTVKVRLHRVRDKLRQVLGAATAMPPAPHMVSATRRISIAAARGPRYGTNIAKRRSGNNAGS